MSRAFAAVVAALACAGTAHAAGHASLPSPTAPLSAEPPLAGGARSSAENVPHSIAASTNVVVAVDGAGSPFAVTATQRLDVRGVGDYFFTIGAPVLTVRAPEGSESMPGIRTGSILWAGFDPGRRLLVARATLDPIEGRFGAAASDSLLGRHGRAREPDCRLGRHVRRRCAARATRRVPRPASRRRRARAHTAADDRAARLRAGRRARHHQRRHCTSPGRSAAVTSTFCWKAAARSMPVVESICASSPSSALRRRRQRTRASASGNPSDAHARARTPVRGVPREPRPRRRQRDGLRLPHDEPAARRSDRNRRSPPATRGSTTVLVVGVIAAALMRRRCAVV